MMNVQEEDDDDPMSNPFPTQGDSTLSLPDLSLPNLDSLPLSQWDLNSASAPQLQNSAFSRSTLLNFATLQSNGFTRLETLHANQTNTIHIVLLVFILIGICFTLTYSLLAKYKYNTPAFGFLFTTFPHQWNLATLVSSCILFGIMLTIAIIYTIRIATIPSHSRVTHQIHSVFLCWSSLFYLTPINEILQYFDIFQVKDLSPQSMSAFIFPYALTSNISFAFSISLFFFYLWIQAESYASPVPNALPSRPLIFYLARAWSLIPFITIRILVGTAASLFFDFVPLIDWVTMVHNGLTQHYFQLYWVILVNLYELGLVGWTLYLFHRTASFLRTQNYLQTRTKQIGFRFFVFHTIAYLLGIYFCKLLLVTIVPGGEYIIIARNFGIYFFDSGSGELSIKTIGLIYTIEQAWCNLPASAYGLKGWFCDGTDASNRHNTDTRLTYRVREPTNSRIRPHCFVLETAVTCFNFSWLVYSYRGGIQVKERSPGMFNEPQYKFVCNVFNQSTEVECVIYESEDRIIVAFKGTTSLRDLKTDLRVTLANAAIAFPEAQLDQFSIDPNTWKQSKLHAGFVSAFLSVKSQIYDTLARLMRNMNRSIFFTGHSLGGSLAALCALGVKLEREFVSLEYDRVYVYTFGAPRVGNHKFAKLYDRVVSGSWRVELTGDLIPLFPLMQFQSIGNKAFFTNHGQLFIDPSFGELNFSFFCKPGMDRHRKEAYAKALLRWCSMDENQRFKGRIWSLCQDRGSSSSTVEIEETAVMASQDYRYVTLDTL